MSPPAADCFAMGEEVESPPARPWRSRHHIMEAAIHLRAADNAVRADQLEDARETRPDLFKKTRSGKRHTSAHASLGDRYGSLQLVEAIPCTDRELVLRYGSLWRCACDCGGEKVAWSYPLARHVRAGGEPACNACVSTRKKTRHEHREDVYAEAYRRQFVDYGTLWTRRQTERLAEGVLEDLVEAFGPVGESEPTIGPDGLNLDVHEWRMDPAEPSLENHQLNVWAREPIEADDDDDLPGFASLDSVDAAIARAQEVERMTRQCLLLWRKLHPGITPGDTVREYWTGRCQRFVFGELKQSPEAEMFREVNRQGLSGADTNPAYAVLRGLGQR